jgi:L-rhamnose mutarotase
MQRYGHVIGVKPEQIAAYEQTHAANYDVLLSH